MKLIESIVIIGLFILLICFVLLQAARIINMIFIKSRKNRRLEVIRSRRKTREHLQNAREWGRELEEFYAIKEAWIK